MKKVEITLQEFGSFAEFAAYSDSEIFDKMRVPLENAAKALQNGILGKIGSEAAEKDAELMSTAKHVICLSAFRAHMAQMDLILTPTGFGVVSNESIAPASKARVDDLRDSITWQEMKARGTLLEKLRDVEGWGASVQALNKITSPLYSVNILDDMLNGTLTLKQWNDFQVPLIDAVFNIQSRIGSKQYAEIMEYVRGAISDAKNSVMFEAADIIRKILFLSKMNPANVAQKMEELLRLLDDNLEVFEIYANSPEYKASHYEGFKNTAGRTAFIAKG